ncbi:hypothetical protein [Haloferula sargassicola]|uniref:Lipoprotein n=1 Tax=Haloferula sargassicola TaxID=490096 RepID=A0ABP9UIT9_9BACT
MSARMLLALAALALPSCVGPDPSRRVPASEVRPLLPGTWTCQENYGGASAYMEKTFRSDGTASGFIDMRGGDASVGVLLPRVPFRSRWRFDEQGNLVTYDVRTEVPGLYEEDWKSRDRILHADDQRIDFIDVDSGDRGTFLRKAAPADGPTTWSL